MILFLGQRGCVVSFKERIDNLAALIAVAETDRLPALASGEVIRLGPGKTTTDPAKVILSGREAIRSMWINRDNVAVSAAIESNLDDMEWVKRWAEDLNKCSA